MHIPKKYGSSRCCQVSYLQTNQLIYDGCDIIGECQHSGEIFTKFRLKLSLDEYSAKSYLINQSAAFKKTGFDAVKTDETEQSL